MAAGSTPMERRQHAEAFLRDRVTGDTSVPSHQIVLLGGNPLPIRVAAEALGAEVVHLVFTKEVAGQVAPLTEQLRKLGVTVTPWRLERASSAQEVWDLMGRIRESVAREPLGLHYTGGTKVMSTEAVQAWVEANPPRHWRSYLDGRDDALRFAGVPGGLDVSAIEVPIEQMLALHGRRVQSKCAEPQAIVPGLAERVARAWCEGRKEDLLRMLPPHAHDMVKAKLGALRPDAADFGAGAEAVIDVQWRPKKIPRDWQLGPALALLGADAALENLAGRRRDDAVQYAVSGWLEDVIFARMKEFERFQEIWNSVHVRDAASEFEFELDVVARRGHRLFVISCTIDDSNHAKFKGFEALQHAHQVGGDFARYGLFTLAGNVDVLHQISDNLGSHWQAPTRLRVFGLAHLRNEDGFTHTVDGQPRAERFESAFDGWS